MTPFEIELALSHLDDALKDSKLGLTKTELRRLQRARGNLIKALVAAHELVAKKALSEARS